MILALLGMLLALRWIHTVWLLVRYHQWLWSANRPEWTSVLLFVSYLAAVLASFGAGVFGEAPADLSTVMAVAAAAVGFAAVTFRIAALQTLRSAFMFGTRATGVGLVQSGPYQYMKHPLLVGYGLEVAAMCLTSPLPGTIRAAILSATALGLVAHGIKEERALHDRFGVEWTVFAQGKLL